MADGSDESTDSNCDSYHLLLNNDRATLGRPFKTIQKVWVTFINLRATFGEQWQLSIFSAFLERSIILLLSRKMSNVWETLGHS